MSDFLTRLIARHTRTADVIQPHVPSLFEPQPDAMIAASGAPGDPNDGWHAPVAALDTQAPKAGQTIAAAGNSSLPGPPTGFAQAHVVEPREPDAASPALARARRTEPASPLRADGTDGMRNPPLRAQRLRALPDAAFEPEPSREAPAPRRSDRPHAAPLGARTVTPDIDLPRTAAPRQPVAGAAERAVFADEASRDRPDEDSGLPPRAEAVALATARRLEPAAPPSDPAREFSHRRREAARDVARAREAEPTVHVTIGRIEIRAEQAPARGAPKPRDAAQAATLADYLRACAARSRG